jgi:hypothetical protein
MAEGDYVDFLKKRVPGLAEIYGFFLSSNSALPIKNS